MKIRPRFMQRQLAKRMVHFVADLYGYDDAMILGNSRSKKIAEARHVAMTMIREKTDLSLPEIAELMNRDHTTVLHALRKDFDMTQVYEIWKDEAA